MRLRLLALVMIGSIRLVNAQNPAPGHIDIKILDTKQNGIDGATVSLVNAKNSSLVKINITAKDGSVAFEQIKPGGYFVMASAVGYQKGASAIFQLQSGEQVKVAPILLQAVNGQLSEVSVQASKPFIERQIDRVVVNVNNSIVSAGSSVMDVLARSPGVLVDQNDNISMKGKQGVIVMIDGKPNYLSATDLANLLRATPASSVDKIELITNPSAKFEAAGSAGIINIKLKKDLRYGVNGSVTMSIGQGVYNKVGTGISLNYRNSKINIFGNYNYNYRGQFNHLLLDRRFYNPDGSLSGAYEQNNYLRFPVHGNTAKASIDYSPSKNTTIGVQFTGLITELGSSGTDFSDVLDSTLHRASYFKTNSGSNSRLNNFSGTLNYKHTIDTAGQEITADLDYARYIGNTFQNYTTSYYNLDGTMQQPDDILTDHQPGNLDIYSVKADYTLPLSKQSKFEAGFKSSYVKADNNIAFYNIVNGAPVFDTTKSNHFIYKENINALYANFNQSFSQYKVQLGLRAEQTISQGNQLTTDNRFKNNYLQLFPSLFISDDLDKDNGLSLSIGRRIDRPTYKQLNPFKFYIDPSTFVEGNPYLQPQLTYVSELNYTYKQKYTVAFSYSNTSNNITNILIPDATDNRITIQTDKNLATVYYYSVSLTAQFDITNWWNSTNNLNTYYNVYAGNLANTPLNAGKVAFDFNSTNSFKIAKNTSAELDGVFTSGNVYGYLYVNHTLDLSGGVQQTILKGKGTIKLNVTDILRSNNLVGTTIIGDYSEVFRRHVESRVGTIAFIYRFGNNKVAPSRARAGGAEDEKKRAN